MSKSALLPLLLFLFGLSSNEAFGCAVITVPSLDRLDPSEYIFIGKVKGSIGPQRSDKFHGEAWSLQVEPVGTLNMPKSPSSYFVVTPFDLASDCKDQGVSKEKLLTSFPIGSEVRIVAKEARYAPRTDAQGNIRLEVLPDNLGSVARNFSSLKRQITTVSSVFDYQSYVYQSPCGVSEAKRPDYESNAKLPEFEFRKELFRLRSAKTENAKLDILTRMVHFPSSDNDYFDLIAGSLIDMEKVASIRSERELSRQSFLGKLVLSC